MAFTDRLHNRGSISTGYDIDNSLKLEADNAERMQRSYASITGAGTPTSTKIATISFWLKRTELQSSGDHLCFLADSNYTWIGFQNDGIYILGSTAGINLRSSGKFRDTSAWYHIVVAFDTTQSTASNRVKVYVNGEQWTEWGVSSNYGAQNNDIDLYDLNTSHYLGWSDAQSQSGYYAEFYLIDGQQLAPTEFGEFDEDSGIWKPKAYGGTFGVQGYHLDFEDSSALGADVSGNGNNFTNLYNITSADQATDTPTNNFATWLCNGQLFSTSSTLNISFNEGGTNAIGNSGTGWVYAYSSQAASSGKWYYEGIVGSSKNCMIGACPVSTTARTTQLYLGQESNSTVGFQYSDGNIFFYTGYTTWESGGLATGDIVGFAMDLDNGKAYVSRNGVWFDSANPATNYRGLSVGAMTLEPYMFAMARYNPNQDNPFNFGGYTTISISTPETDENGYGNFEYAPPSGFYALCTKNLAEYG